MKRLTMYTSSGDLNNIVVVDGKAIEECLGYAEPLQRLAEYEDTGLTPEQCKELAEVKEWKNMTNYERIKKMSVEELAEFLCEVKSDYQWADHEYPSEDACGDWKEWLESERCDKPEGID